MVAHLVRLKLALLRNSLKRSPWQLVGLIIGGLYGLGILALLLAGLAALGAADPEAIGTVVVLAGAAVVLGWLVVPVVLNGLDMTLDPARFTTYSIPMKSLLAGLLLSSFIGIPGAITLLASVGTAASWWSHPLAGVVALLCGALGAVTCITASRAVTAASASLASSRRFKDVSGIVVLLPLLFLGPIINGISSGVSNFSAYLPQLANSISWTPLGAVWAVPAEIAQGHYGPAGLKFLIALATIAALVWVWKACLARALVTPAFAGGARRGAGKMGFFGWFPATPAGAVAARCLTYWFRDPRYSAGLLMAPLLPLVFVFAGSQFGGGTAIGVALGFGAALAAFLVAWSISADISYDNTAFALHVATGISGLADRTGRAMAAGVLALPLGVLYAVVGAIFSKDMSQLPGTLGLVLAVVGSGLGLASVFSARFTSNVPLPGDSPLKTRPGNGFSAALIQLAGFAGLGVLVLPELILLIVALVSGQVLYSWLALVVGMILGAVFLAIGVRQGAKIYDKRAPELLLSVSVDR
ncbi:transporter [Arthrobacter sp. H35-D1]|uniref:transporter n=1 Tax=Arthrobacter sp. H35-D1 TaxID=3046202 RepID=UPI0024BB0D5D|nr:transporter [Arthrobacter sp. H35-D1]MDJ0313084.1 transporter [Arthrobacter sp. H35-D1]